MLVFVIGFFSRLLKINISFLPACILRSPSPPPPVWFPSRRNPAVACARLSPWQHAWHRRGSVIAVVMGCVVADRARGCWRWCRAH